MTQLKNEQDAIKQAVEAGYLSGDKDTSTYEKIGWIDFSFGNNEIEVHAEDCPKGKHDDEICGPRSPKTISEALQDLAFWVTLGKARGWIDEKYPNGEMRCNNKVGRCESVYCEYAGFRNPKDVALRYFETLMSGGDMEEYWKGL